MAQIVTVAADVVASDNAVVNRSNQAGEAIVAGQAVTKVDGKIMLASKDDAALRNVVGIALVGAAAGQPCPYAEIDSGLDLGVALDPGTPIYLGNDGTLRDSLADVTTGQWPVLIGMGVAGGLAHINCSSPQPFVSTEAVA